MEELHGAGNIFQILALKTNFLKNFTHEGGCFTRVATTFSAQGKIPG